MLARSSALSRGDVTGRVMDDFFLIMFVSHMVFCIRLLSYAIHDSGCPIDRMLIGPVCLNMELAYTCQLWKGLRHRHTGFVGLDLWRNDATQCITSRIVLC